jgi:Predicted membrane protein (DUF2142)
MDKQKASGVDMEVTVQVRHEGVLVWLLCVLAGARVFFFCAAFPFFNNTDEQAHFDLVLKYSHGHFPRGMENFSPESIRYLALCSSPEFFVGPERFPDRNFPAPVEGESPAALSQAEQSWGHAVNAEAWQPPLYYAVGGVWLKLGESFGFSGAHLLYWVRFLNVFLAAALVWLSFLAAREFFPEQTWLRLCVPLLTAFIPQDMFYGIGNDTLSPLCFGAAFICVVRWLRAEVPEGRLALCLGLAISATYLTKVSNAPLLAIACFALALSLLSMARSGKLRRVLPALGVLTVCIVVPVGAWILWMQYAFGDATGSAAHIQLSGWTRKPFAEWWQHPIFSWRGGSAFVSELLASFWRGEFYWHGKRLASGFMDTFYIISSLVLVAIAAADLPRLNRKDKGTAGIVLLALLLLIASVAFLVLISIRFDFGEDFYPSRASPYLWSGRLISGAFIPFVILYVYGLGRAFSWTGRKWLPLAAVAIIAIAMTISEVQISNQVFTSAYNWFHIR